MPHLSDWCDTGKFVVISEKWLMLIKLVCLIGAVTNIRPSFLRGAESYNTRMLYT